MHQGLVLKMFQIQKKKQKINSTTENFKFKLWSICPLVRFDHRKHWACLYLLQNMCICVCVCLCVYIYIHIKQFSSEEWIILNFEKSVHWSDEWQQSEVFILFYYLSFDWIQFYCIVLYSVNELYLKNISVRESLWNCSRRVDCELLCHRLCGETLQYMVSAATGATKSGRGTTLNWSDTPSI